MQGKRAKLARSDTAGKEGYHGNHAPDYSSYQKGETIAQSLADCFDYGQNPDKTQQGELISSYQCDAETADAEFLLSKAKYKAITGREQKKDADILCYQVRQSFVPGEITPKEAKRGRDGAVSFRADGQERFTRLRSSNLEKARVWRIYRPLLMVGPLHSGEIPSRARST